MENWKSSVKGRGGGCLLENALIFSIFLLHLKKQHFPNFLHVQVFAAPCAKWGFLCAVCSNRRQRFDPCNWGNNSFSFSFLFHGNRFHERDCHIKYNGSNCWNIAKTFSAVCSNWRQRFDPCYNRQKFPIVETVETSKICDNSLQLVRCQTLNRKLFVCSNRRQLFDTTAENSGDPIVIFILKKKKLHPCFPQIGKKWNSFRSCHNDLQIVLHRLSLLFSFR